jgi:hypothetical protein
VVRDRGRVSLAIVVALGVAWVALVAYGVTRERDRW